MITDKIPMLIKAAMTVMLAVMVCNLEAETLTVCEALSGLTSLNGRDVKVRGAFIRGHTGQHLFASPPCATPTLRDGWIWRDFIAVWPANGMESVSGALASYGRLAKECQDCKIVVTLRGRLKTRDHFEVHGVTMGPPFPEGIRGSVASLLYSAMDDIKVVPREPGELEQEMESRRDPYAMRFEPGKQR